jgi:DNA-binding transcriptional ArsR family regulator
MQLFSAHLEGLVAGEIQEDLDIPNSTLSHHLDKLKNEEVVTEPAGKARSAYLATCSMFLRA